MNINVLFNRTVYCKGKHLDKVGLPETEQGKKYKEEDTQSKGEQEALWERCQVCEQREKNVMDERKNLCFVYISSIFFMAKQLYYPHGEKKNFLFFSLMTRKKNVKGYFRVRYI